jgi:NAD(P)-dependent dehydrogenase (short-subunit alcohol dehydrogenase family)
VPLPGGSGYGSSKAAMLRLTETLARELERVGSKVLVVALGPGFVRTEMTMLQVTQEAGRRWIPGSGEALDAGKDRPPEDCARSAVELLRILGPELNGRIFDTGADFAAIAKRAAEIKEKNLCVLRAVPLQ